MATGGHRNDTKRVLVSRIIRPGFVWHATQMDWQCLLRWEEFWDCLGLSRKEFCARLEMSTMGTRKKTFHDAASHLSFLLQRIALFQLQWWRKVSLCKDKICHNWPTFASDGHVLSAISVTQNLGTYLIYLGYTTIYATSIPNLHALPPPPSARTAKQDMKNIQIKLSRILIVMGVSLPWGRNHPFLIFHCTDIPGLLGTVTHPNCHPPHFHGCFLRVQVSIRHCDLDFTRC